MDFSETPSPTPDHFLLRSLPDPLAPLSGGSHSSFEGHVKGEKNTPPFSEKWIECVGLESAILCLDFPIPIYIFDNHNHVFYAWAEALKMGWFEKGATLVHMDEHFDAAEPVIPPDPQPLIRGADQPNHWQIDLDDLENVWKYTNEILQIATYIKPALKLGMFTECIDYVESKHFEIPIRPPNPLLRGDFLPSQNVINLDIDVFHADMSHISWEQKIDVLKQYLPQTKVITMATSPYFIDQQKAIQLVRRVLDELFGS
jgi:hypothetical protein